MDTDNKLSSLIDDSCSICAPGSARNAGELCSDVKLLFRIARLETTALASGPLSLLAIGSFEGALAIH